MVASMKRDVRAVKSYKKLLLEVRAMMGQSGESAFHRAKKLVEIFNDGDFRADNATLDDHGLAEILDGYCEKDLCLNFWNLKAMLEFCPDISRWKTGDLAKLRAEMLEASRSVQQSERPERTIRRATLAELEQVSQDREMVRAKAATLEKEVTAKQTEVERLRQENQSLREKLARAEGRISELERAVKEAK